MTAAMWRGLSLAVVLLLGGCASKPPIPLAQTVDLPRMYGGWYIIATIPNWFEKGMVRPYDVYSRRPDGDIGETFYMQKGGFSAPRHRYVVHDWVRPGTGNAAWRVQVFWPVNLPFLVLYVDPQYRYVMFGEQNRTMGWIYARSPDIPDADYQALLARFARLGYDRARFRKFVQRPSDIGKAGYWSAGVKP
jgi:apolipoprotein D and lipocalin family protein